jgi:hypothetical protein
MKFFNHSLVVLCLLALVPFVIQDSHASEIKRGDKVTIVTPATMARLCPYPDCGQNQHITRIPKGTVLEVEGIMDVKLSNQVPPVKWFEVTYKGKRGWISIFDTDKVQ